MRYWLMKTEPEVFSIQDLKKMKTNHWDGVRNYQARNFMRDQMKMGDLILFYHSNATPPGIAGLAKVSKEAYPDFTAWDKKSEYFDPKASKEKPTWMMVDVQFVEEFKQLIPLESLRMNPQLKDMLVIKKGMRLSIQPVSQTHFNAVLIMASL
ncbi:MAG: EVE domain-containing protein [Elusimicrobiota bacterium]